MNRQGLVLVLVLLAVLALELLAMSAFAVARLAQLGSRIAQADATLQATADNAVEQAIARVDVLAVEAHEPGTDWAAAVEAPDGIAVTARLRRLESWFVLAEAMATPLRGSPAHAAALVRLLPPEAIVAGFPAVLSTPASTSIVSTTATPQGDCALDRGYAPPALPLHADLPLAASTPFGNALGLDWQDAARIADARALPPDASDAAPVLAVLDGPAVLSGRFRGILLVDGDLTLQPGSEVNGLVAVRGALGLAPGARILGAVRAAGVEGGDGEVVYDRCAIETALTAPALIRAYRPGARWRLPAF